MKTILIVSPTAADCVSTILSLFNLGADTKNSPEYLPLLLGLTLGGAVVVGIETANHLVREQYAIVIRTITAGIDEGALVEAQALRTFAEAQFLAQEKAILAHGDFNLAEKVMIILLSSATAAMAAYISAEETKQQTQEQLKKIASMHSLYGEFMQSDFYRNQLAPSHALEESTGTRMVA